MTTTATRDELAARIRRVEFDLNRTRVELKTTTHARRKARLTANIADLETTLSHLVTELGSAAQECHR